MGKLKDIAATGRTVANVPATRTQPPGSNLPDNPLQTYLEDLQEAVAPVIAKLVKVVGEYQPKYDTERKVLLNDDQACKAVEMEIHLDDLVSTIEMLVRNHRQPLDEMSELLRFNGGEWVAAGKLFRDAVRNRIEAFLYTLPPDEQTVRTEYGSLALLQLHWKFEVVEPEKLPRECCSPDRKMISEMIKAYLKAAKPHQSPEMTTAELQALFPGVRVWREPQLIIREPKA